MPPRWITEEDWLRTAGAAEQSSHVRLERSSATVGVQPPSPQEEPPSPQEEPPSAHQEPPSPQEEPPSPQEEPPSPQDGLRGAVDGTQKRSRIVTAALSFGLGLILATMFYASEVADQRDQQAFSIAPPRMIRPETVDSAAASPAASDSMPETQQTAPGQTARTPDPMPATQQRATASGAGGAATAFAQVHRTEAPEHQDVCAAHGMQREYYYRGTWRYWRCIKR